MYGNTLPLKRFRSFLFYQRTKMAKSYLITLSEADLQTLVFSAVDRAIKLNKLSGGLQNPAQKLIATKENINRNSISEPQNEMANG